MKTTSRFLVKLGRGIAVVLLLLLGVKASNAAVIEGVNAGSRKPEAIESVDGAVSCYKPHRDAGERFEGNSQGADYRSIAAEWKALTVQTNATGDVPVVSAPAVVRLIRVRNTSDSGSATAATSGIILVKNGSAVIDGAAAGKTAGQTLYDGVEGTMFRTSVVLNFANAADNPSTNGKIEILYRLLDPRSIY